jgi:hypothetical protein
MLGRALSELEPRILRAKGRFKASVEMKPNHGNNATRWPKSSFLRAGDAA